MCASSRNPNYPVRELVGTGSRAGKVRRRGVSARWIEEVPQRCAIDGARLMGGESDQFVPTLAAVGYNNSRGRGDDVPTVSSEVDVMPRQLP